MIENTAMVGAVQNVRVDTTSTEQTVIRVHLTALPVRAHRPVLNVYKDDMATCANICVEVHARTV